MTGADLQFVLPCAPFIAMMVFSAVMAWRCGRARTPASTAAPAPAPTGSTPGRSYSPLFLHPDYVPGPPAEVMNAWREACRIAFERGEMPVVNFPRGRFDSRFAALVDQCTGKDVPIHWLPADRFPTDLPAQYFNPDLILPEAP